VTLVALFLSQWLSYTLFFIWRNNYFFEDRGQVNRQKLPAERRIQKISLKYE
jgi:hypothetical protein